MKAVLTRVSHARVTVEGQVVGEISAPETCGILALVGISRSDTDEDVSVMARKIGGLRILPEEKSATDLDAPVLVVSQFTLQGSTAKGRRPTWINAAPGEVARPLFEKLVAELKEQHLTVEVGEFGAMMQVSSVNEGPFTVLVDTSTNTGN